MKRNFYLVDLLEQIHLPREKSMSILIDAAVDIFGSSEFPLEQRQNILSRLATDGYFIDACLTALKATVVATVACAVFESAPDFSGVNKITENDSDLELLFGYLLKENTAAVGEGVLDAYVPPDEKDYRLSEISQYC